MAKATLREIMVKAHKIAKKLKGDYQARLSYALKVAWAEYRGGKNVALVKLVGTEKQVAWAEDIRAGQIALMKKHIEDWERRIDREGEHPGYTWILEKHKESLEKLCGIKEAKTWIEKRNLSNALNDRIVRVAEHRIANNLDF